MFGDSPINNIQEDTLGLNHFIEALVETVITSPTPYTISLYGEWGSGKTSTLKIIKKILENEYHNDNYKCIWINAWELSTLENKENLRKIFVAKVLSNIFPFNFLKKCLSSFFLSSLKDILGTISFSKVILDELNKLANELTNLPIEEKFSKAIKKSEKIFHFKKIIIFIDDLDRIDPRDVLTILDSINIFFNVSGCVFILALDHYRINDAISKDTNIIPNTYTSTYLDKVIQLTINIPIENYDIKNYISGLFNLSKYEDKYKYIIDIYTALITNSVGKIPRTIKILCSKYNFYYHFLYNGLNDYLISSNNDYFPFKDVYLKLGLLAMLCFKYAYKDLYDLFLLSESFSKDFFLQIEYSLKEHDSKYLNKEITNILNRYKLDKMTRNNLLKFISAFILAIELNETSTKIFSVGGIFLLKSTAKILMDKPILKTIDYALPKNSSIDPDEVSEYLNNYFNFYLEYLDGTIKCIPYDSGIKVVFNFLCGPFTFQLLILYKNDIIRIIIISPRTRNFSYKYVINDWVKSSWNGFPKLYFNPSEKEFINFEEIICEEYANYKANKIDFFLQKAKFLFCNFFEQLVMLKLSNDKILYKIKKHKDELLSLVTSNFKLSDGWIVYDNLDIFDKWCNLSITHKNWCNKLSICIEPQDYYMQKIVVGIRKSTWKGEFKNHSESDVRKKIEIKNCNINFKFSPYWVIYHSPGYDSYTLGNYYPSLSMSCIDDSEINRTMISSLFVYKNFSFDITRLSQNALF